MGKQLVIAEKPSVGQDYARALGGGFQKHEGYLESDERIVSWAVGHLVELAEPEDYDDSLKRWSIKTLPVLPEQFKLRPDARNKKQLDVLKRLIKRDDVDDIVNGCDAGREGELIFQYIMDVAKTRKPVQRLWVSSMTKDAIRDGFANLRPGEEMEPLAAAARSRSEADWLVGMNATRAATVKGRALGGVVSLGRVQTPTLALIVRRDVEIDAFVPQTYFQVDARFGLEGPRAYVGRWFEGKEDRTPEREIAEAVAAAAGGAPATVASVKRSVASEVVYGAARIVANLLGGVAGRVVSNAAYTAAGDINSRVTAGVDYTEDSRRAAIVTAFETMKPSFVWNEQRRQYVAR